MIVLVGCGTLGVRVAKRLPRTKPLLLIDHDIVRTANVPRQYAAADIGMRKVDACKQHYRPDADVLAKHLDATTVGILSNAELVIDCTDNMLTRRVINDYCSQHGIAWIHSGLSDTIGAVAVFLPGDACFSCVYPSIAGETCTDALDVAIADKVADIVALKTEKFFRGDATTKFIRISADDTKVLSIAKRSGCLTCTGTYEWLAPRRFYITYCTGSKCMAAKPIKHSPDHGVPIDSVVEGVPVKLFPNGEIHFLADVDDDVLYRIAQKHFESNK